MGALQLEPQFAPVKNKNLLPAVKYIVRHNILETINRRTIAQALQCLKKFNITVDSRESYLTLQEDISQLYWLEEASRAIIDSWLVNINAQYEWLYNEASDRVARINAIRKDRLRLKHQGEKESLPDTKSQEAYLKEQEVRLQVEKKVLESKKEEREVRMKRLQKIYDGQIPVWQQELLDAEWDSLEEMWKVLTQWQEHVQASLDALSREKGLLQLRQVAETNRLNCVDNPMRQQALEQWRLSEVDLSGKLSGSINGGAGNWVDNNWDNWWVAAKDRPLIIKEQKGGWDDVCWWSVIGFMSVPPAANLAPRPWEQLWVGTAIVSPMPWALDDTLIRSIRNEQGKLNVVAQGLGHDGFKNLLENISYSREGITGRHNIAWHSFFIPPKGDTLIFQDMQNMDGFNINNIKDHSLYGQYLLQNSWMEIMSNKKLFTLLSIIAKAMKIAIPPNGIDIIFLRTNTEAVKSIIKWFKILTGCGDNIVLDVKDAGEFEYISFESFDVKISSNRSSQLTLLLTA